MIRFHYCGDVDGSGYHSEQERAMEVMDLARRLFAEGDRFASGWFDRQGRDGKIALFVCAVAPTSEEVEALDGKRPRQPCR